MADAKRAKPKVHTTPVGVAVYPHLNKPDTKFNAEGVFRTKLRLSQEDAQPIIKLVDAAMVEARKQEKLLEAKKKAKKGQEIPENCPYTEAKDDNGEETGEIEFTFATAASGKRKDGSRWERKMPLFDAKGKPVKVAVWGGSKIKVAFTVGVYFINAKVGYGVKLYLEGAQIIELVTGGEKSASSLGFGQEEGFEAEDSAEGETSDDSSDEGGDDNAAEGDDATAF